MADPKQETKAAPAPVKPKDPSPAPVSAPAEPVLTLKEQIAASLNQMLRSDSYRERLAIANHILDLIPE